MRKAISHICTIFLVLLAASCGNETENEITTGNVIEIAPSQAELDELKLENEPKIIQDFFAVDEAVIGSDFCYDLEEAKSLILGDSTPENWTQFEVHDNYFTLYNRTCKGMLEFMEFEMGGESYAFLSQMNSSIQQFDFLKWDAAKAIWVEKSFYPSPSLEDYFAGITDQEYKTVKEYGADFIYIDPGSKSATFVFSELNTQLNMGEKELLEFDLKPTYTFDLLTDKKELYLKASPLSVAASDQFYFVAYSKTKNRSESFGKKYNGVLAALYNYPVNTQIITYGENDFDVYFPADTFNFSHMEQFEVRDGFWFYHKGYEPLDLGLDQETDVIIQRAQAYFGGEE